MVWSKDRSVLEVSWNLQLGDYKNVNEAKRKRTPGCMLPTNFDRYDLFHIIKNLDSKLSSLLKVKNATLPKFRQLLNAPLEQFKPMHIVVDAE